MRLVKHIAAVAAALFICLVIPCLYYMQAGGLFSRAPDARSGASLVVPDQPSGTFLVLVNKERHPASMQEWTDFFTEKEVGVIMEDVHCLVTKGDAAGKELAERYQARLAENQMQITQEDGTLVVSKAENGMFDVVIISTDMADNYDYSRIHESDRTAVLSITGENR